MKKSRKSKKPPKPRKLRVLTRVEKLDGYFPGLATEARQLLDSGVSSKKTAEILSSRFSTTVTESYVRTFRGKRWGPQKDKVVDGLTTLEIFFQKVGGNYGLDLAAFAKVHELLNSSDLKEANSTRLAILKIRAQDLKEDEFKFKADQAKSGPGTGGEQVDPEAQSRNALRRIREIFGLTPEDAPGPPPSAAVVPPAAKESA